MKIFVFISILVLATIVRFVYLDKAPAGLFYDEIDLGYQVRSLLTTGRDYRGENSPLFFRSFNTDKTPLPILFSAVTSSFFGSREYQVRSGAAIAGIISVFLAMVLAYQLTRMRFASAVVGLVFAFSPWQIQFSRIAFETIFMLMTFLATIVTFWYWRESKKAWVFLLSGILLGLNVYTYRPMSLFAPLMTLSIFVIYFREIWAKGIILVAIWSVLIAGTMFPFLYATTLVSTDQPRINQISIFSNKRIPIMVLRNREIDSNDFANPQIGKSAVRSSFFFHNKGLSYLVDFSRNYVKSFSFDFLLVNGDPNGRHSPDKTGELVFLDVVGLIAGLVVFGKRIKEKNYQFLLALLLLSPIPAALTVDGADHASRLMIMSGPLLVIIGVGYSELLLRLTKSKKYFIVAMGLIVVWIIGVIFYLHRYFVHYPIESSRLFGYGFKQSIEKINKLEDRYQKVRLTTASDPPMLYYLFWSGIPPSEIQSYGVNFDDKVIKNSPMDKVKPLFVDEKLCVGKVIDTLNSRTLYLVSFSDLPLDFRYKDRDGVPVGIKLLNIVKYPDNEIAYYLITRDTDNMGNEILPNKITSCK